jgi:hypothetical protein
MVIAGALLIIWAGYTILNEFTHFAEPEPLRSELRSGKIGRFYPTSTLIMIWGRGLSGLVLEQASCIQVLRELKD